MKDKLLIGVLGRSKSGKTYTWDTLFGHSVKTGKNLRRLYFNESEYVNIFLLSCSPSKRHKDVGFIMPPNPPAIVLCSLQYTSNVKKTLKYFEEKGYFLYIQWLNPGYKDDNEAPFYNTGMIDHIMSLDSIIGVRNGKIDPNDRIREITDFIYGWAHLRSLVKTKRVIKKLESKVSI